MAGKGTLSPRVQVFGFIDNRGNRDDDPEDTDRYVSYRQTCAQALALFLERTKDPNGTTSLNAKDLDALYHENTDFDTSGPVAKRFEKVLDLTSRVLATVNKIRKDTGTVFKKLEVFALILLFEELTRDPNLLVEQDVAKIAHAFEQVRMDLRENTRNIGRVTSGATIQKYYDRFYWAILPNLNLSRLDPVRFFTEDQKEEIRRRDGGKCQLCGEPVPKGEEEFDHIKPWILGGKTTVENGRLVHAKCHPRGKRAVRH